MDIKHMGTFTDKKVENLLAAARRNCKNATRREEVRAAEISKTREMAANGCSHPVVGKDRYTYKRLQ
jgi:hypothetical protein